MSETISMTDILLTVSVGCNLWFLFLLLYDRIMETRLVRFLRSIAGLWRSLGGTAAKPETARVTPPAETPADIIGKSRFRMASTRTTAAIPTQEAATSEKGIELTEEEATFDDGNTETVSRPAQVPEDKLDETFTEGIRKQLRRDRRCGQNRQEPGSDNDGTGAGGKGLHRHGRDGAVREADDRLV